ncbi:hypothetical protein Ahy_A03g016840 isoform B [Arachis hypogaea]|uniref:Thioredoxin domain-containing protein n=1 Tax=Arachis hypogaea TaxID=3818 RepID=A0A445E4P7_ARAHY|nr:hypothetical protein Ahy_A03g016840 isoform B [Arachis hypogaea]
MRNGIHLFLFVLLTFPLFSHSEVITLTSDTFSDKIKEKDTAWFVNKNLGTLWDDLGKAIEGTDEIEIGEVDCGTDKPVCSKADIHSYPTFKLFYDGEEVARYRGSRDVDSLKNFVLEEADKAATNAQAQQLDITPTIIPSHKDDIVNH